MKIHKEQRVLQFYSGGFKSVQIQIQSNFAQYLGKARPSLISLCSGHRTGNLRDSLEIQDVAALDNTSLVLLLRY